MSDKKRDKKGRVLKEGERQREDGRYEYRYTDQNRRKRSIYSWRLVASDPLPPGRRACEPLRDLEKHISHDLLDGLDLQSAKTITLDRAFDVFIKSKTGVKASTKGLYEDSYNRYVRKELGQMKIGAFRPSTIKTYYIELQTKRNLSYSTVKGVNAVLSQVFQVFVNDDVLRKNPCNDIIQSAKINPSEKKTALTRRQQENFLRFVYSNKPATHWRPLITFLFGTGVRIGEAAALKWQDVDFANREIIIRKTVTKEKDEAGRYTYPTGMTKTVAGQRSIPMLDDVELMLRREYLKRSTLEDLDDIGDLNVFFLKSGKPICMRAFTTTLTGICERYNRYERRDAKQERREPELMPIFTPHIIRHTFCTRLCEQKVDIKVIQEVMGHADAATTMNIYNDANKELKKPSFEELNGKFAVTAIGE